MELINIIYARLRLVALLVLSPLLALVGLILLSCAAQAAIIDLTPLVGEVGRYISAALDALLFVGLIIVGKKLHDKWGIEISAANQKFITDLVMSAANGLIEKGKVKVAGLQIDVDSVAVANAANAAILAAPLAAKSLGLTPEKVADMIKAQVPQTPAVAAEVATTVTPGSESITVNAGAPA